VGALESTDNGIVAGRRGTGKTHALRYLAEQQRMQGHFVVFIDIDKDLGSTEGLYADPQLPLAERASRLLIDVINLLHSALLDRAFADSNESLIATLEMLFDHYGEVVVVAEAEVERASEVRRGSTQIASAGVSFAPGVPSGEFAVSTAMTRESGDSERRRDSGRVAHRIHYGAVSDLLERALDQLGDHRVWLIFDEWSALPLDLQPYLAEALRRLFFGSSTATTRIAVIPHRTNWRVDRPNGGGYVGLEVGAEIFPLLDLDEFVVFPARSKEEQAKRASDFFKALLFRHLNSALPSDNQLASPEEMVSLLFTQVTALQELIRAAEGVPRDALSIVARAAQRAGDQKISTDHVRAAAAQVYASTKEALLAARPEARRLLDHIVGEVIDQKRARAFLLEPDQSDHPLIRQLLDDRILHLIKRGYSSKDSAGVRYDVLQIDYGCYVRLLSTRSAPLTLFGVGDLDDDQSLAAIYGEGQVEVPEDDYRAIRRAVLDLGPALVASRVECR
jgi:KaiC/GvpD/RAD55 family RecA-like ATPase